MARNYINNKDLYSHMIEYKNKLTIDKDTKIPNYIGQAIILICNNLSKKINFVGYSYKTDMISDAICDCVAAVNNFNPDKTQNPFAYFTQIAWNAFIRRIDKEKKQNAIKHKNYLNSMMNININDGEVNNIKSDDISYNIVDSYEKTLTKTKTNVKLKGIEKFQETSDEKRTHGAYSS
jgi:hypothetical protein